MKVKLADKPGSVVDSHSSRRFVTLRSSNLPADDASHAKVSLFDLAPNGVYRAVRVTTSAVGSYPAVSPSPFPCVMTAALRRVPFGVPLAGVRYLGSLFSVALFITSRCPAINRHSALWSPDFPLRPYGRSDCLASFGAEFNTEGIKPTCI